MMFAFSPIDFIGLDLLFLIRIIATIGGAIVGWFVCDPLTRGLYWLATRAAIPGLLLFASKAGGSIALALVVFGVMQFVSFGDGSGFGFGPGSGGVPGKGAGAGGDKPADTKDAKAAKTDAQKGPRGLEPVEIEIINGKLYKDDERYFLVKRAEPALSRGELEDYLKKNKDKVEIIPVLTKYSIGRGGEDSPLSQLLSLTEKHNVRTTQPKRV
jgi:hypothetical protein